MARATLRKGRVVETINSGAYRDKFVIDGVSKKASNELCKTTKSIIKRHDGTAVESYAFIDNKGNKLAQAVVGDHGGRVDVNVLSKLGEKSLILIHNHPSSGGFSLRDTQLFLTTLQLSSIIAVGRKGNVSILTKPTDNIDLSTFYSKFFPYKDKLKEEGAVKKSLIDLGLKLIEV